MKQVASRATSIDFRRNTRRYIPEDITLQEDTSSCKDLLWCEIISRERLFWFVSYYKFNTCTVFETEVLSPQ
jgi:hypothetical protein